MAGTAAEPSISSWRAWRPRRGWGLVLPVIACLPVARALARAIRVGWVPIADEGIIAIRAHDVLTTRMPVLGQMSLASGSAGAPTRSPGAMGYWVLAPAAQVGPLWLIPASAAVVAAVALVGTVHLAGRRGGLPLAVTVTAGLVLSSRAVDPANHAVGWNPSIALAPMALLVLLAWSVGVGERRKLPATVVVASFVAQVHIVYVLPAVAAVAVALAGGWAPDVVRWWRARRSRPEPETPAGVVALGSGRALVVSAAVGLVLWVGPLAQQLLRRPGNLVLLTRSADGETQGWGAAVRALGGRVGLPPAWARGKASGFAVLAQLDPPVASTATIGLVVLVAGLVALVGHGVRRGRRDAAVPPALLLALLGSALVILQANPTDHRGISVAYTSWWLIPVGMLAWVVLGSAALASWPRAVSAAQRVAATAPRPLVALTAVVAVATLAVAVATPIRDPEDHLYPVAEEAGDAVVAEVRPGRLYEVRALGSLGFQMASGLAYRVRRAGGHPVIRGGDGTSAGPEYMPTGARCDAVVEVLGLGPGRPGPAPGAVVLAEIAIPPGPAVDVRRAVVTLAPDDGSPSC